MTDGIGEDHPVAMAIESLEMRPAPSATDQRNGRLGRTGGRKPWIAGFAQPGPVGFVAWTVPTIRGWTWWRPLKLIPSQSMKPWPVQAAARRSVSWS